MVRSRSTADSTYRFQMAALIVFLSGVDKVLSFALQLAYLAGKVEWKWLTGGRKLEPGVVECYPGLTTKVNKLHSLGLDLTELQWIVNLRNNYIHSCRIYVGYRIETPSGNKPEFILRACGPDVSVSGEPLVALGATEVQTYTERLADHLGRFLDGINWQAAWALLGEQLRHLRVNPEPEYSQIVDASAEEIESLIASLNERYVGEGLRRLREEN